MSDQSQREQTDWQNGTLCALSLLRNLSPPFIAGFKQFCDRGHRPGRQRYGPSVFTRSGKSIAISTSERLAPSALAEVPQAQRIELPEYTDEIWHAVDPAFTWAHNRRLITWARNPRVGLRSVVRDFSEFADRRECRFRALQRRARSAV